MEGHLFVGGRLYEIRTEETSREVWPPIPIFVPEPWEGLGTAGTISARSDNTLDPTQR